MFFINIKELVQVRSKDEKLVKGEQMKHLPTLKNAYLQVENDSIVSYGTMENIPELNEYEAIIDCTGKMIFPSWCDSHTHIVFAGHRETEFADKIKGLNYEEIAARGGGILNSVEKLRQTSEDELLEQSKVRLEEIISLGTGAVEIKSGYGLDTVSELKMLRVIKRLQQEYPVAIKATLLAAHAFPKEFLDDREGYVTLIQQEIIPKVAQENLADFIDVFCEKGYFSVEQTESILQTAQQYGLRPKIHVNQFNSIGGVGVAVKNNALSVDHLEVMSDEDFQLLQHSETLPVALPSCSFFIQIPYTPARKIIDLGMPLVLASDYNPGSTPSGNMNLVVALACIQMKLTPEEAINAATINGAFAMNLEATHGSITVGKKANFFITKSIPSYAFIPYSFGSNWIESVYLNGKKI